MSAEIATGEARALSDNGIPYAFVDRDVKNGFQYFYRVTAFDINSLRSGPSSLESAGPAKSATPRGASTTLTDPDFQLGVFGRGNTPLQPREFTIDPATGRFNGPPSPTSLLSGEFTAFAAQLLPAGAKEVRIDSVPGQYYATGTVGTFYLTVDGVGTVLDFTNSNVSGGGEAREDHELPVISVPADPTVRQQLIARGVDAPSASGSLTSLISSDRPHFHSGDSDWAYKQPGFWSIDPPTALAGGSRWFTGANETVNNPTLNFAVGQITGYTILRPNPYTGALTAFRGQGGDIYRRFYGTTFGIRRAADVRFHWGAAGIDSVVDVTHNVRVPFTPNLKAGYGFVTDSDGDGKIVYGDFYYIPGLENTGNIGSFSTNTPRPLVQQPVVLPIDVTGDLNADGNGFGIFVNGEAYLFQGPVPTSTVWTLRTYNGTVSQTGTTYAFAPTGGIPAVPGLRFVLNVASPAVISDELANLSLVHTVPDPYYAVSQFDLSPASKELKFVNLPAKATIRIYSMSGVLVDVVNHDDPTGGGAAVWNLRNRSNQFVASGVYFYHVSTPDGKTAIKKFTVINSGFAR
jgi:hypothetical protein